MIFYGKEMFPMFSPVYFVRTRVGDVGVKMYNCLLKRYFI